MSSWSYLNGTFLPKTQKNVLFRRSRQPASLATSSASNENEHASTSEVIVGNFVEVSNDVATVTPPVVRATHESPVVIGVATSKPSANRATVRQHGLAFAWVTRGDVNPPLSGFYAKSINGVHESNVVVDVQGDSFTIAATKDKELEDLIARFNALAS